MEQFFLTVVEITVGMAVLILFMLPLLAIYGKRFTARCRYILWTLVLIRLAIPVSVGFLPAFIEVPLVNETEQFEKNTERQELPQDATVKNWKNENTEIVDSPAELETDMPYDMDKTTVMKVVPNSSANTNKTFDFQGILHVVSIVYLVGLVAFFGWNLVSYFGYTTWLLRYSKSPDDHMLAVYSAVCGKHDMRRQPKLRISEKATSPAAFGCICRTIVLPDITFTDNGLTGTLSHELIHCKRGDLWVKLAALVARSFHWFNPLVHWAAFRCEMEMELSCDEAVLNGCDDDTRAVYGQVMLDIIRRCRRQNGALTTHFNPRKNAVKARLEGIMDSSKKKKGRWLMALCLLLCLIAGAAVACQVDGETDREVLWTYQLTGDDGLQYSLCDENYTLQGTYATGDVYDIVAFSAELLSGDSGEMLDTVLPVGYQIGADTVRFFFRCGTKQGYYYEMMLDRGEQLSYSSIREITTEEAMQYEMYAEDMAVVTSLDELKTYVDEGVISTQLWTFYEDLLSGESEIAEYNSVQIETYTIRFAVPLQGSSIYSSYFTFTVTESGLETLPVGQYSWQVEDLRDVMVVNRRPVTAEEGMYYDDTTVQKLQQFLCAYFCYNTPVYGENLPHPAIRNYICNCYGDAVEMDEFAQSAKEEFGITDIATLDLTSWITDEGLVQSGGLGGTYCMRILSITQEETEKVITVQYYADRNELLPSHKIAYHFDADGVRWLGYEVLAKAEREPWGLIYCPYGNHTGLTEKAIPDMSFPTDLTDLYMFLEEGWVTETYGDGTNPIYYYRLYEDIAHTQNEEIGLVWLISVFTQEEFTKIAEEIKALHEVEPDLYDEDVYVSGYGHSNQVLGWDEAYVYVLSLPTDVQWIENNAESEENYHKIEEVSKEMLSRFLQENRITANPNCKARVYDPAYADLAYGAENNEVDGLAVLTSVLAELQKEDAKAFLGHESDSTETKKYPAIGLESGYHYEKELEDYTFTLTEEQAEPTGEEYVLYSDPVGAWEVHGWYDSNWVTLCYSGQTYYFQAKHPSSGKFGNVLNRWFCLAEYEATPYQSVFPEEGQSYLAVAQTFADSYFGRRLQLTSGSPYAWSYVTCTVEGVEDVAYVSALIEGGLIPRDAYPYYLTVVFTYENPFGEVDTTAELYTGDDPNVPENAYQMRWCCYLTKDEDGWHASPGGTGW